MFAERLFSLADRKELEICVSSLSFSNIDYVLHSTYAKKEIRKHIATFKAIVTTLAVDSHIIDLALTSDLPILKMRSNITPLWKIRSAY